MQRRQNAVAGVVGSDLEVPTELAEVQVKITADDGSGKQAERSFELRGNNSPLPFSFGIAPVDGNPNTDLVVEFDAWIPGNRLFTRKVVTGFVKARAGYCKSFSLRAASMSIVVLVKPVIMADAFRKESLRQVSLPPPKSLQLNFLRPLNYLTPA